MVCSSAVAEITRAYRPWIGELKAHYMFAWIGPSPCAISIARRSAGRCRGSVAIAYHCASGERRLDGGVRVPGTEWFPEESVMPSHQDTRLTSARWRNSETIETCHRLRRCSAGQRMQWLDLEIAVSNQRLIPRPARIPSQCERCCRYSVGPWSCVGCHRDDDDRGRGEEPVSARPDALTDRAVVEKPRAHSTPAWFRA